MNIFKWHRDHSERWFDRMSITTRYGAAWLGLIKGIIIAIVVCSLSSCEKEPYCELKNTCSIDYYGDLYNCKDELICYD